MVALDQPLQRALAGNGTVIDNAKCRGATGVMMTANEIIDLEDRYDSAVLLETTLGHRTRRGGAVVGC